MENKMLFFVAYVITCMLIILACPFALVWSVNTLFSLTIPYNIWTWLSSFIIIVLLRSDITNSNK